MPYDDSGFNVDIKVPADKINVPAEPISAVEPSVIDRVKHLTMLTSELQNQLDKAYERYTSLDERLTRLEIRVG